MTSPDFAEARRERPRADLVAQVRDERWCRWTTRLWLTPEARAYADKIGAFDTCPRYRCGCGEVPQ